MENKRNFRINGHGTVDCDIELFRVEAVEAQEAVYDQQNGQRVLITAAVEYVPAIEGEWHPTTLDYIPEGVEIAPYIPPHKTKEQLIAEVAARRYEIETAGITLDGKKINTTRESQTMLASAFQSLSAGLISFTNWKDNGEWIQVDLATLTPIASAVANHVSNCFTVEMEHCQAINLLDTQTELDSYDINQGWPQ